MNIQDEIAKQVAKKAMAQINSDRLAVSIAPALEKSIRAGLLKAAKDIDWSDWIFDCLPKKEIESALKKKLSSALKRL